jgi:GntR family transcriptional regulator, rspAB operon transcriptional repressor
MSAAAVTYDFLEGTSPARGGATARVYAALRDAIITLELKPGTLLDKQAIASRMGVSRFPVGEALGKLQDERLVEIFPQNGSRVALIRLADARENMFLRRAIECEAVRILTKKPGDNLVRDLRQNLRYQVAAIEQGDLGGFHSFDLQFHAILLDSLGFERVKTAAETARVGLERVRRLLNSRRRLEHTLAEHERIVEAFERRDAELASTAMVGHLDAVMAELEVLARDRPELFADLSNGTEPL